MIKRTTNARRQICGLVTPTGFPESQPKGTPKSVLTTEPLNHYHCANTEPYGPATPTGRAIEASAHEIRKTQDEATGAKDILVRKSVT